MTDYSNPPKSPTLVPPRKSVELEDPGAHDLETSENEEDVFADASEGQGSSSRPHSPIPTTRVEKVDDRESHGEVPGTAAYQLRTQDAVPDELEIIPEGSAKRPKSGASQHRSSASVDQKSIPKTIVEKIDPLSPSHGDIPGTAAHSIRKADAVPDVIRPASSHSRSSEWGDEAGDIKPEMPVPTTVVTKVDSNPSHGEVSGTDAFDLRKGDARPDVVEKKGDVPGKHWNVLRGAIQYRFTKLEPPKSPVGGASPIAADGGFGHMDEESIDHTSDTDIDKEDDDAELVTDNDFEEDFDKFEAGAEDEDFGDFDEGSQQSSIPDATPEKTRPPIQSAQAVTLPTVPFPLLDLSELETLDDIQEATSPYLDEIFPSTKEERAAAPPLPSTQKSIFLTDRSLSLWSQLVAPPPLQPPNWVRSRIRRLFLVSLGVPVDLDEILPASKQKKLILPSIHLRSRSQSPPEGRRQGSRVRLKQNNASSASIDQPSSGKSRRRKGPTGPPELDLQATKILCATTVAALSNMTDSELQAHIKKLEVATMRASEVLEYLLKRRDSALGDKEAFEGVIENLVKHARKVRK